MSSRSVRQLYVPLVAALLFDQAHEAQLRKLTRDRATLLCLNDDVALLRTLASRSVDVLVTVLANPSGEPTLPVISEVRRALPQLPIVAYVEPNRSHIEHLPEAGRHGVALAILHGDTDWTSFAHVLRHAPAHALSEDFTSELGLVRSEYVRRFCQTCFALAAQPITVESVSANVRATRQHIAREFAALGMRSPGWYVGVSRALLATRLLEQQQSMQRIACAMHFPSTIALRQALRRYTGMPVRQLRERGGFQEIAALVRDDIRKSAPS